MDLLNLAKYPFLKESSVYLKEHGPSLDELLGDIAYERVKILGKERVLEALESGVIGEHAFTNDVDRFCWPIVLPVINRGIVKFHT